MPIESTYISGQQGINIKSVGQVLCEKLEADFDGTKTLNNFDADEIFFEWSNQDLTDESVPDSRFYVVRVHSGRRKISDGEIGVNMQVWEGYPTIHVYANDPKATQAGKGSERASDLAQYIINYFGANPSFLQSEGIDEIRLAEDNWVPNNGDPNWHHWTIQLYVRYYTRRL